KSYTTRAASLCPRPNYLDVQVRPQRLRHHHRAVLLLVILHDRDPCPAHRQTAPVERVLQLRLLAAAVPDPCPARLERLEVRAGGNLLISVLPRQPDLDIVSLRRRESHVPCAQHHRAVWQPEASQDILRV